MRALINGNRLHKIAITSSLLFLTVGIHAAHQTPASSYEISIYRSTPQLFWMSIAVAIAVSVLSLKHSSINNRLSIGLGSFLGGFAILLIFAIPLIRGYYYLGNADPLTHLGTTKDLMNGVLSPFDLIYPAAHYFSVLIYKITTISLPQTLLIVVLVFCASYLLFLPLAVRELEQTQTILPIAVCIAFLMLPLNQIQTIPHFMPTTQAILFLPTFLYIAFRLLQRNDHRDSLMFLVIGVFYLLLHPQQAINGFIILSPVFANQLLSPTIIKEDDIHTGSISIFLILYAVVLWQWLHTKYAFSQQLAGLLLSLTSDPRTAGEVTQRGQSLGSIGSSLFEIFVKLFSVSLLFSVCAGLLMSIVLFPRGILKIDRLRGSGHTDNLLRYLSIGFIFIMAVFVIYLVANMETQYFRHIGFMMVISSLFSAIFIDRILHTIEPKRRKLSVNSLQVIFVCLILFSTLTFFPSPFIQMPSEHVSEAQVEGYKSAITYQNPDIHFIETRSLTWRYSDGIYGQQRHSRERFYGQHAVNPVPRQFADGNISSAYSTPKYLAITERDKQTDIIIYNGFRYDERGFRELNHNSQINRVHTNGGFDLFLINPSDNRKRG